MTMNQFAAKYGIRTASLIIKSATEQIENTSVTDSLIELSSDLESALLQYCLDNREAILGLLIVEKVD
jgi:hypothetical protein